MTNFQELIKADQISVLDQISEGYWIWYVKEDVEYMSPRFWEILGFKPEEKKHHPSEWQHQIHPDDLPTLFENFNQHVKSKGETPFLAIVRYFHKDGRLIWIRCEGKVVEWAPDGAPIKVVGTHKDVTIEHQRQIISDEISNLRSNYIEFALDRKKFFEFLLNKILALSESEYGFIGEILEDQDGKYLKTCWITDIAWNDETKKFYLENAPNFIFRNLNTLFGKVIKTGEPLLTNDPTNHPDAYGTPSGHPDLNCFMGIPIYYSGKFIAMAGIANRKSGYNDCLYQTLQPYFEVVGEMINAKSIEDQLQNQVKLTMQSARLASLGELAAGVGHEINNPLSIISGQIYILEDHLKSLNCLDEQVVSRFEKMNKSIIRISNIIKSLKTFSRADSKTYENFDLFELTKETVEMVKDLYGREKIKISFDSPQSPMMMFGSRGRIQQVIVNLITNAKDATAKKQEREINIKLERFSNSFKLCVADNGSGISDEVKEKIFDPFFTTKEINKGTGIGLSLVSTIIKEHNGKIDLKTEINVGSIFTLNFPINHNIAPMPIQKIQTNKKNDYLYDCQVLIVDDEEDIKEVLGKVVSIVCPKVITAGSGEEALKILKTEKIDIIISDMKMPKMDGFEFLNHILTLNIQKKPEFLFISGGVELSIEQKKIIEEHTWGILPKPFYMNDIISKFSRIFPNKKI